MTNTKNYKLKIRSKYLGDITQTWTWYGEMKGDLKALLNCCDYATDVRVYIDSNLNIAGGPSHLVNPDSIITVTEI